jgi:hypothetical protein
VQNRCIAINLETNVSSLLRLSSCCARAPFKMDFH